MEAVKTYMNRKYALEIGYDDYPENPFVWEEDITLCTFLRRSMSPCRMPEGAGSSYEDLINYLGGAEEIAKDGEIILKSSKYRAFNVLKYEHSAVNYYIGGSYHDNFDTCPAGIIFMEYDEKLKDEDIRKMMESKLVDFTDYCNGEVYSYILHNLETGDIDDSLTGIYTGTDGVEKTVFTLVQEEYPDLKPEDWKQATKVIETKERFELVEG